MKIFDLIVMCVRNLTRRKFRTILTVTGVVIGTCSIVLMISLGVGISVSTEQMLAGMTDLTMIQVYSQSSETPLTDEAVETMQAMDHVVVASPYMSYYPNNGYGQIYAGRRDRYSSWAEIVGVYPEALEQLGYTVRSGELALGTEGRKIKVLMGPQVPYNFNDTRARWPNNYISGSYDDPNAPDPFFNPLDTELTYRLYSNKEQGKELSYTLVTSGILQPKDNDWETLYTIYMSIDDLKQIKADFDKLNRVNSRDDENNNGYERVKVKVDKVDNVGAVQNLIKEMGFYVSSMESTREAMQQSTQQIQMILGILGAVALLVAAISIVNTMIMSVYERTREIGVMKVLGCLLGNIRTIFLIEAGLIGFIGGVVGIGVSYAGSFLINRYGGAFGSIFGLDSSSMGSVAQLSVIPLWLVLAGLAIATAVGLVAGFYPAERAVRISALEAIRQE